MEAEPFAEERPKRRFFIYGCTILAIFGIAIGLTFGARGWKAFVAFGISKDLSDYYSKIESNYDIDKATKQNLLERIDRVRARVRQKPIGFFRWMTYSESFDAVLKDGIISPDELRTLDREIDRLEKEIEGTG